ncbi:MAG: hypothetical protein HND43_07675 [Armatimonadetes bacterium]|nr:hypothetical protein [Armatimonadota bacterium]MCZ7580374.1 hypothetical protein [Fimbriimonadaceae bacterium]NOG39256.1 hypothetical protein [Armatimonadota bacterium]GIK33250.1 MAG: hypothetical protein BroJett009_22420 [Armatimonadota bacterium]
MSLSVTSSRVKEKCGITVSDYDATISNLIGEITPVVEFAIRGEHLADAGNTGLQATLKLGLTEVICGELLEQIAREPGASESVSIGDLALSPPPPQVWSTLAGLKRQGWARLRPFLKPDVAGVLATVLTGGSKIPEESGL